MAMGWVMTVGLAVLAGCAGLTALPAHRSDPVPAVQRGPAVLNVQLKSAVAEPYYVLSGPSETYRAYRVNKRFQRHLYEYAAQKSATDGPSLDLTVTLEALSTGYHQIGGTEQGGNRRVASRWRGAPVQVAAAGSLTRLGILGRFGGFDRDGNGLSIPYEITKRAAVTATVEVAASGRTLARETATADAEEIVRWEDFDAWTYDYSTVFETAFRGVVAEVDRVVERVAVLLGR